MDDLYASVVLHDVKNQLAELALRLGERGDAQTEMKIVMNAAYRLSRMLLVHRQASGLLEVNVDSVNPSDFLRILAAEYRELFPGLSIEVGADRAPSFAFFDDALVRLALGNATHNACRFARSKVELAAYEKDGMLVFRISDDGPGFPENVLVEGGKSPSPVSGESTGLGLYLAGKIAGLHHMEGRRGHIELNNAGGAMFCMMLP